MPDTDKVTIIKAMNYRGQIEEWSNTYHLDGTTPTSDAEWKTLFDAIIASEKTCYGAPSVVYRAYGYEAGSENANSVYDYQAATQTVAGTFAASTFLPWAGDQAGWLRVKRTGQSGSGKSVYLRKYFHSGYSPVGQPDNVVSGLRTAYAAHGALMLGGTLPGGMKWVAPQGQLGTLPVASPYTTTRTLKRRGKRPTPPL